MGHLLHNLRRQKNLQLKFARSPLVLLPEEVLFGEVDQVDHRLRSDEEMFVQHFNLKHHKSNLLVDIIEIGVVLRRCCKVQLW